MDVVVIAVVLVGLAAFVAAPLYAVGAASAVPDESPSPDPQEAALEDLEVDRASGLYDETQYSEELEALRDDVD